MLIPPALLVFAGLLVATLGWIIVVQRNHLRRYERFRTELAEVLGNFSDNLVHINERLTAAGYPPRGVLPATRQTASVGVSPVQRTAA